MCIFVHVHIGAFTLSSVLVAVYSVTSSDCAKHDRGTIDWGSSFEDLNILNNIAYAYMLSQS